MSQSDGKRRIKIQKLMLDPLSNWFYSRREIGDSNGVKYQFLLEHDPQLSTQASKKIYEVRNGDDTRDFIFSSIKQNINQGSQRFMYSFGNKYSFVSPTRGPQNEKIYTSFSQQIIRNLLDTTDKIFTSARQNNRLGLQDRVYSFTNGNFNAQQFRNSGAGSLLDSLESNGAGRVRLNGVILGNDQESSLQAFLLQAFHGRNVSTSGQEMLSIHDVVYGIIDDLTGPRYNTGENKQEVIKIAKFLLLKSLINSGNVEKSRFFSLITQQTEYSYEYSNVHTSTPYVKNTFNNRELSNMRYENQTNTPSKIRPEYNFYEEEYENNINIDDIGENLLPNLYVRHYYQQASSLNPGAFSELRVQQLEDSKNNYKNLLTLTDSANQDQLIQSKGQSFYDEIISTIEGGETRDFYNSYSELLDPESPTYTLASENLLSKNNKFSIGHLQMLFNGLPSISAPMGLNVSFTRDTENTDFANYLRLRNTTSDPSVAIIENLASFTDEQQPVVSSPYLYSTEYLFQGQQYETSAINVNLNSYNVENGRSYIFDNLPQNYSSLVLQKGPYFPEERDLSEAKSFLLRNRDARAPSSYDPVFNGTPTPSEVIAYRVRKRLAGRANPPQEIYIANAGRQKVVYKDTQIKYGIDYVYDLAEYRLIYGAKYNNWTISTNIPVEIVMGYLGLGDQDFVLRGARGYPNFTFENLSLFQPTVELLEIPVYDEEWNRQNIFPNIETNNVISLLLNFTSTNNLGAGGIAFPKTRVSDLPPTAPTMQFFPRAYVDSQIDVNINTSSGKIGRIIQDGSWDQTLEIISIGDNEEKVTKMKEYQDAHSSGDLDADLMRYRHKSEEQVKNITFYRTTGLNLDVEDYKDLYPSFNPDSNDDVVVRKYSTKALDPENIGEVTRILSYDLRDTIQPNVNYFYTCVVEDVHGNISNPSEIYRVRLLSENGMVIPEISNVVPTGNNRKRGDKNLGRYMQIDASNIQTFPFVSNQDGSVKNSRSLGAALEKQIENQSYIVRLTSKDTGRKFDLKLNFVVRVNGVVQ
jgi:hypothetical protein